MPSAPSTASLKDERVSVRNHIFNTLLVLVMKVSFLTYFVLTPWLSQMSQYFSVSEQEMTLVAPVYELGKFVGVILIGRLCDNLNLLRVVGGGMIVFIITAALLWGYLLSGLRTHTVWDFFVFLVLYFSLSIVCITPQFGLAILKKTNSDARCKKYVMLQGLLACLLQGSSLPLGETIGRLFGWKTEFIFLALFVLLVAVGIYAVSTPPHVEACQPKASAASKLEGERAKKEVSYWSTVWALTTRSQYRSFQVFNLALGIATGTMYMLPMYGMLLLPGYGLTQRESADWIGFTFMANFIARVTALLLVARVSSESFVKIGASFLFVGSLFPVISGLLPASHAPPMSVSFVGAGFVLQLGVGLVMPNCKAGALVEVPDEDSAAANSILKLAQLIFTAFSQVLATLSGCDKHFDRFFLLLLLWNGACAVGMLWRHCAQRSISIGEASAEARQAKMTVPVPPVVGFASTPSQSGPISGQTSMEV